MKSLTRQLSWTVVVAAMLAVVAGGATAQQQVVKIGLLATLEGPFAAGGQDGMRGAELAVKQRGGMVAGKKIEIIKASSDAKPDVAVNATRKLVEQDKVDIMVGPRRPPRSSIPRRTSSASTPRARSGWRAWGTTRTRPRTTRRWP